MKNNTEKLNEMLETIRNTYNNIEDKITEYKNYMRCIEGKSVNGSKELNQKYGPLEYPDVNKQIYKLKSINEQISKLFRDVNSLQDISEIIDSLNNIQNNNMENFKGSFYNLNENLSNTIKNVNENVDNLSAIEKYFKIKDLKSDINETLKDINSKL